MLRVKADPLVVEFVERSSFSRRHAHGCQCCALTRVPGGRYSK